MIPFFNGPRASGVIYQPQTLGLEHHRASIYRYDTVSFWRRPTPSFDHAFQRRIHHHPQAPRHPVLDPRSAVFVHARDFPLTTHTHTAKRLRSHRSYASRPSIYLPRQHAEYRKGGAHVAVLPPIALVPRALNNFPALRRPRRNTASRFRLLCRTHMTTLPLHLHLHLHNVHVHGHGFAHCSTAQ
ncbi:hypothetical protein PMIN01_03160 [Paraphaeosphaeria minitans]|uniref:Uncharacterized protein n=1 Tax=Paraphaeosphaeria minitans TaxID=565426 RepID=A0A9P6GLK0_9PLEO|nr:hypothetical protein PMIN01_03160 [Paraphaeosphaeria minitans]